MYEKIRSLFSFDKYGLNLFRTYSCWPIILHTDMIVKIKLVVNINPKSLTSFSHLTSDPEILSVKYLSYVFFPTAIAWNLSGLSCMQFMWNQFIKVKLSDSRTHLNSLKYGLLRERVLSSA